MPPQDPRKPPEIDTSNLVAKPGRSRDTDPETLKRYGAAVLAALLLFCLVLTAVMSPPKEAGKGRLFEERKPDAPLAPEDKPWIERLMTLSPWGGGHEQTAASSAAPSSSSSADNAAWSAAVAAAKADVAAPNRSFAAPRLASGGLPGLGSLGGSSGASAAASRPDGVFRGEGGTGMIVGDLKHAAARAAWRGGPKVTAEDMKGFSAQQVDVLQNTHAGSFAVAPGGAGTGGGGLGPGDKARQGGAEPALDEKKQPNLADSKEPHQPEKQKPNMPTPSMGGGPGQNCQALSAVNDKPPAGAVASDQSYTQSGTSLCQANADLAQHKQLMNGDSARGDSDVCARTCNQGKAAPTATPSGPGASPSGGSPGSSQDNGKGIPQLQKEVDQKIKELAKRAKNDCVEPNGQAADLIAHLDPSPATSPLGQAAASTDQMTQSVMQANAGSAAGNWQSTVSQAQSLQRRANSACRQLAQPSTLRPVDDKQALIAEKIQQDGATLDRATAGRGGPLPGPLRDVGSSTDNLLANAKEEKSSAQRAFDKSRQTWRDFRQAVTGGSISQLNQKTGQLVNDAGRDVSSSLSDINGAQPGNAASFQSAQANVGQKIGNLSSRGGEVGYDQALQSANKAAQ